MSDLVFLPPQEDGNAVFHVFSKDSILSLLLSDGQPKWKGWTVSSEDASKSERCCGRAGAHILSDSFLTELQQAAWREGVLSAVYEISKEMDVKSQDLRDGDFSLDEMAAKLAERVLEAYAPSTEMPAQSILDPFENLGQLKLTMEKTKVQYAQAKAAMEKMLEVFGYRFVTCTDCKGKGKFTKDFVTGETVPCGTCHGEGRVPKPIP